MRLAASSSTARTSQGASRGTPWGLGACASVARRGGLLQGLGDAVLAVVLHLLDLRIELVLQREGGGLEEGHQVDHELGQRPRGPALHDNKRGAAHLDGLQDGAVLSVSPTLIEPPIAANITFLLSDMPQDQDALPRWRERLFDRGDRLIQPVVERAEVHAVVLEAYDSDDENDETDGVGEPPGLIVVVNKADKANNAQVMERLLQAKAAVDGLTAPGGLADVEYFPVSARSGRGVDELRRHIITSLDEGPPFFPDDVVTAFEGISYEGPSGPVKLALGNGQVTSTELLPRQRGGRGHGNFQFRLFKLSATTDPVQNFQISWIKRGQRRSIRSQGKAGTFATKK